MLAWKIVLLVLGSAVLVFISRASLMKPGAHGFYRFFAWETILLLFLHNVSFWFTNPFTWYQSFSWIILVLSFIPLFWGIRLLRKQGKPVEVRESESNLLAFEKTTRLVTTGIYRYIRHPLYSSLLLLAWGIFFKLPSWVGGALVMVATGFLFLTALADEHECLRFFGDEYREYIKKTSRFIPFLF
jgi:protein-S-isoprenylcysteine O-methyltransferase Ste14